LTICEFNCHSRTGQSRRSCGPALGAADGVQRASRPRVLDTSCAVADQRGGEVRPSQLGGPRLALL